MSHSSVYQQFSRPLGKQAFKYFGEKAKQNFLLEEICAQFAENGRSWHYFMPTVKQYLFFDIK